MVSETRTPVSRQPIFFGTLANGSSRLKPPFGDAAAGGRFVPRSDDASSDSLRPTPAVPLYHGEGQLVPKPSVGIPRKAWEEGADIADILTGQTDPWKLPIVPQAVAAEQWT